MKRELRCWLRAPKAAAAAKGLAPKGLEAFAFDLVAEAAAAAAAAAPKPKRLLMLKGWEGEGFSFKISNTLKRELNSSKIEKIISLVMIILETGNLFAKNDNKSWF